MSDVETPALGRGPQRPVIAWAVIALVVSGLVVARFPFIESPAPWLFAALWAVTVLAGVAVVNIDRGEIRESVSPTEVSAVLLMVFLTPPWAIVVAATAIPVAQAMLTRAAVAKMVFNTAWQVTGIGVGSVLFQTLAGPTFTARPSDLLAATLGAVVYVITNAVAFTSLLTGISGEPWRAVTRREFRSRAADFGMAMTGVLVAVLAVTAPVALPLLALPTLMDYLRARARRADVELEMGRKRAEAANQAKTEFLSEMSHELRTPLNAILGFGQLLELSAANEEDAEAAHHIVDAGQHLLALIDDVLDLSRIEAGTMSLSPEPVHIGDLLAEAVALIQPMAEARSITLDNDAAGCELYVTADRRRCRQVMLNLLSNAVKYNHEHGDVTVTCERHSREMVRVSVRDSGPGIEPARRHQLFEPFERLGADRTSVEGTGLGLALTKQLVEAMGGTVGVDTTPGKGSTFWVDLPLSDAGADAHPPTARERTPAERSARTLLLVEHDPNNVQLVETMMRRRPEISVVTLMQGSLAIDLAREHQPDVIVLDLLLPDMSAGDILRSLREHPQTRDIPVVIVTEDATPDRKRELRDLEDDGAFAFVARPLDVNLFLDIVDAALRQRDTTPSHSKARRPGV